MDYLLEYIKDQINDNDLSKYNLVKIQFIIKNERNNENISKYTEEYILEYLNEKEKEINLTNNIIYEIEKIYDEFFARVKRIIQIFNIVKYYGFKNTIYNITNKLFFEKFFEISKFFNKENCKMNLYLEKIKDEDICVIRAFIKLISKMNKFYRKNILYGVNILNNENIVKVIDNIHENILIIHQEKKKDFSKENIVDKILKDIYLISKYSKNIFCCDYYLKKMKERFFRFWPSFNKNKIIKLLDFELDFSRLLNDTVFDDLYIIEKLKNSIMNCKRGVSINIDIGVNNNRVNIVNYRFGKGIIRCSILQKDILKFIGGNKCTIQKIKKIFDFDITNEINSFLMVGLLRKNIEDNDIILETNPLCNYKKYDMIEYLYRAYVFKNEGIDDFDNIEYKYEDVFL